MSNWRINVGMGPVRYQRTIGQGRAKRDTQPRKGNPLVGCLVLVITFVLTMAGCVACMGQSTSV